MVLDLRLTHDRFASISDPTLNGRLHCNDIDKSLNESVNDKIRKYHTDYNNNPPNTVVFIPTVAGTNGQSQHWSHRSQGRVVEVCSKERKKDYGPEKVRFLVVRDEIYNRYVRNTCSPTQWMVRGKVLSQ